MLDCDPYLQCITYDVSRLSVVCADVIHTTSFKHTHTHILHDHDDGNGDDARDDNDADDDANDVATMTI